MANRSQSIPTMRSRLRSAHGFLQGVLASQLPLRHTPTLTFAFDDSVQRGMRISELLDEGPDANR